MSGTHNVYLKYVGASAEPIQLNWLEFTDITNANIKLEGDGNNLYLYPNPADDVVNLNLPSTIQDVRVEIYNSIGSLAQVNTAVNERLDISNLDAGIYFLSVFDESNETHYKGKLVVN